MLSIVSSNKPNGYNMDMDYLANRHIMYFLSTTTMDSTQYTDYTINKRALPPEKQEITQTLSSAIRYCITIMV